MLYVLASFATGVLLPLAIVSYMLGLWGSFLAGITLWLILSAVALYGAWQRDKEQ